MYLTPLQLLCFVGIIWVDSMDILGFITALSENLLSPMILFFILGIVSGMLKSDLEIPDQIGKFLAIYLIITIGFKGGVSFSSLEVNSTIIITLIASTLCGFAIPFISFGILKYTTQLSYIDAIAVSAHYGSISIMTFLTASSFLDSEYIPFDDFIVGVLAIMEVPAIIAALTMLHIINIKRNEITLTFSQSLKELASNGSVLLLVGSIIIGYIVGQEGGNKLHGLFIEPFYGMLSLFLLDMGLKTSKQSDNVTKMTPSIVLFGMYTPIIYACIGLIVAKAIGLDFGTGFLFGVLMGSASYIAVPAALKVTLPQANPAIYVPLSLGITFPFNIIFGIPIYYFIAERIWSI